MIRKVFFWAHLVVGVVAGLIIALMAATGVVLTYELQLLAWADREYRVAAPPAENDRASLEQLVSEAVAAGTAVKQLVVSRDSTLPVLAKGGRRDPGVYLDPFGGDVLGAPSDAMRDFIATFRGLHRWLLMEGDARDVARLFTGGGNLLFLLLVFSGLYLWLPRALRWPLLRPRLFFSAPYRDLKARDYHWHHVFGIWCAVPLVVIVATALVFSFGWANTALYAAFGEQPPRRGQAPAAPPAQPVEAISGARPLAALVAAAVAEQPQWRRAVLHIPGVSDPTVKVDVDSGNGRQPHRVTALHVDRVSGAIERIELFTDRSAGRQARSWVRFLHTGEALGLVGQTVAGLVSLLTLFMVWTGLALAWRRLLSPWFRRGAAR